MPGYDPTMAVGGMELDLPDRIHEELLICKICYGKYSSKNESLPKLLVCSHTFCAECIKEYLSKRKKKSKFPCPLCRKETSVPKEGVKGLVNNYTVLGLLDLLETKNQTDSHGRNRSSKTISSSHFFKRSASQRPKSKKWASAPRGMEPGFADLGPKCVSPTQPRRPPPFNPGFNHITENNNSSSTSNSTPGTSSSPSPGSKPPELPVRIPGAPSIGRSRGKRIGELLSMDRPQSMSFASVSGNPYDDTQSILSETHESAPSSPLRAVSPPRVVSPPQPPPRRVSSESVAASPLRCLRKFGKFSEARMQTNAFTQPTRVSVSEITGDIVITDTLQMTVQVFTSRGEYLSLFKVLGVQGACFMSSDKLTAATHRGVEVYKPNGEKIKELPIGNTVTTIPYKFGFIAAKRRSLSFFSNGLANYKEISKMKTGKLRTTSFKLIQDITVNSLKDLIVLDSIKNEIYIMDTDGLVKTTISPSKETCGVLKQPESLITDKWNNILVSDTGNGRIIKFSANGTFARCILNFKLWGSEPYKELCTHGIAVNPAKDNLITIITGQNIAYVAVYQL